MSHVNRQCRYFSFEFFVFNIGEHGTPDVSWLRGIPSVCCTAKHCIQVAWPYRIPHMLRHFSKKFSESLCKKYSSERLNEWMCEWMRMYRARTRARIWLWYQVKRSNRDRKREWQTPTSYTQYNISNEFFSYPCVTLMHGSFYACARVCVFGFMTIFCNALFDSRNSVCGDDFTWAHDAVKYVY